MSGVTLPSFRTLFPEYVSDGSSSSSSSPMTPPAQLPQLPIPHPKFPLSKVAAYFPPPLCLSRESTPSSPTPSIATLTDTNSEDGESDDSSSKSSPGKEAGDAYWRVARKHACSFCGKRFSRPSSLKIHENTHTGTKPYACSWPRCGRHFNVSSNMRRHYRTHLAEQEAVDQARAAGILPPIAYMIGTEEPTNRPVYLYRPSRQ